MVGGALGIIGALLGVAWERVLRRRGKVHVRIVFASPMYTGKFKPEHTSHSPSQGDYYAPTVEQYEKMLDHELSYNFLVGFYNEKEVDTGLTDVWGAIIAPDGSDFIKLRSHIHGGDKVINLSSRTWAKFNLVSEESIGEERFEVAKHCNRIQVRAKWPNGRPYKSKYLAYNISTYFQGEDPDKYMEQK